MGAKHSEKNAGLFAMLPQTEWAWRTREQSGLDHQTIEKYVNRIAHMQAALHANEKNNTKKK